MKLRMSAALVVALSVGVLAQSGPRRDGNWQVTMQMEMSGMPQAMPPMTVTQCVTKEEADDPQKAFPQGPGGRGRGNAENDCKVSDYKTVGNTVSWSMKCTSPNPMTGTGEVTYTGDTYNGTMKMNVERGGAPMAMTMKYSGKRLGDCTK